MNPFVFPNRMSIICFKNSWYNQVFFDRLKRIMMSFVSGINNYLPITIYLSLDCKASGIFFTGFLLLLTIYFSNLIHCLNIKSLYLYLLRAYRRRRRLRGCLLHWTGRPTFIPLRRSWNYRTLNFVFLLVFWRKNCFLFWWFLSKSFCCWRWRLVCFCFLFKFTVYLIDSSPSWSNFIINIISLIFANIPIQIKQFIWICVIICTDQFIESFKKFKS